MEYIASERSEWMVFVGAMIYGSPVLELEFDDRTLSHLQVVIGTKLRRGESFFFSWLETQKNADSRSSVWLSPGIALMFKYSGGRSPRLNAGWLRALEETANSGRGLILLPEPDGSDESRDSAQSTRT